MFPPRQVQFFCSIKPVLLITCVLVFFLNTLICIQSTTKKQWIFFSIFLSDTSSEDFHITNYL